MNIPASRPASRRSARMVATSTAAWTVLAIMPLVMVVANRSSVVMLALAALVCLGAALVDGRWRSVLLRAAMLVGAPLGSVAVAFVILCILSVVWSVNRAASLFSLGEALVPAVAALAFATSIRHRPERGTIWLFAVVVLIACADMLFELLTRMTLRESLGFRAALFIFNKPVIALSLLIWPFLPLSVLLPRRRLVVAVVGLIVAVTVVKSVSGAAVLALVIGGLVYAAARFALRPTVAVVTAGLVAAILIAPVKGDLAAHLISGRALDAMHSVHARDRVEIWQSFGELVKLRWLAGTGFGTSGVVAHAPMVAEVPADRRTMLDVGHPHDMFLQVWSELGVLGAVLALAAVGLLGRSLARLDPRLAAPAVATVAGTAAIAVVGHGAWQGWWIAVIGAVVLWFYGANRHIPASEAMKRGKGVPA